MSPAPCVITSYSIHYTKLYDFGPNYDLPNMTAYCETCAAISNVYWNYRLFLNEHDAKYYDVLERVLYNGVISGVSLSGDKFFYDSYNFV